MFQRILIAPEILRLHQFFLELSPEDISLIFELPDVPQSRIMSIPEVHIHQILHYPTTTFLSSNTLYCLLKSACCSLTINKFCSLGRSEPASISYLVAIWLFWDTYAR
jgi:hypothetical protein